VSTQPLYGDRVRAESFGAVAELYDRARPSYPAALIDALLADGPERVLDVGCGTGIAGALLTARGCAVLGVEVDERMAAVARAKGLAVEVAPFERWRPAGRIFDLVIAGQAWHWIEPRSGAEKAASVLVEGGRVGLFWNLGDPARAIGAQLAGLYAELEPGLREAAAVSERRRMRTQLAAEALISERFEPPGVRSFSWTRTYDTASWLEFLRSHSDHQTLPAERRERLLAAIGAAIDGAGGELEVDYETVLVSARRR
jgi:SAM-dependent methyltransferase